MIHFRYVRYKLNKVYGESLVNVTKSIPVHFLGTLSGEGWSAIDDLLIPYENDLNEDVSRMMKKQHYNARKMFEMGEEFYVSLNLTKLPNQFYQNSIIERPIDEENFLCLPKTHGNLYDTDFLISMCTEIKLKDFLTVHQQLGHIQYFQQYHHQPLVYREAANPGFQDALGDFISLSVTTPKHLMKIGLLEDDYVFDNASQINYLMQIALSRVVNLPFIYTLCKFRYGIFRGEINYSNANTKYWEMHQKYSGIEPPAPRTSQDFDAGAIYYVASDVEVMKYFVSGILQFQLYKAACIKAEEYEPDNPEKLLHNCDFYGNTEVGNSLK